MIRQERPGDAEAVDALVAAAFAPMPFSDGSEVAVLRGLRRDPSTLLLVAEEDGAVVGQAAFSPATVAGRASGWRTLGPVAVARGHQRRGIGGALIREGISRARADGAAGVIVLGSLTYYPRFGFRPTPDLAPVGAPPEFFMVLALEGPPPAGRFGFHPAFAVSPAPEPRSGA